MPDNRNHDESSDLKDAEGRDKPNTSGREAAELGVVRVFSNPGPDAEDRLRRLFSLLVKYATSDRTPSPTSGQARLPGKDSPSDSAPAEDCAEAVKQNETELRTGGLGDEFGNACKGHCGV